MNTCSYIVLLTGHNSEAFVLSFLHNVISSFHWIIRIWLDFTDIQAYVTYDITRDLELGVLGNYNRAVYDFIPTEL